jgi:hypothetical protein
LTWLALPLLLQAAAMLVDELYFHRRRGLKRWESVGHPLDTLSVLACYGLALWATPSESNLVSYALLAAFSCLFVTKDELVHAAQCRPGEHWLHAVLFMLHPIVLGSVALLWFRQERGLLGLSAILTAGFGVYQLTYWNLPWARRLQSQSTTQSTIRSESAGTRPMTTPSRSYAPNPGSETRG